MRFNAEAAQVVLTTNTERQLFGGFMREFPVRHHAYGVNGLLRDASPPDNTLAHAMAKDVRVVGAALDPAAHTWFPVLSHRETRDETSLSGYYLGILKRAALLVARQPTPSRVGPGHDSRMTEHNLRYRQDRICEARLVGALLHHGGVLEPSVSLDVQDFVTTWDDPISEYETSAGRAAQQHLASTAREFHTIFPHPDQHETAIAEYHKTHPLIVDLAAFYS